jgi:rhodanese-related sulfurtransferase
MGNDYVQLLILDLRTEPDWNLFHLKDAERISLDALPRQRRRFETLPANAVVVLVSNDESLSTQAWQHLMALGTPNAYILEGGINHWLDIYGDPAQQADPKAVIGGGDGKLRHRFRLALGERHPAARPDAHHVPRRNYNAKVKLITKVVRRAGCA